MYETINIMNMKIMCGTAKSKQEHSESKMRTE